MTVIVNDKTKDILFQKSDYFSLKKQNDLIFLLHKLNCIVMSEIGNHGYMQSNVNCFSRYLEDENYQFIHYYNKLFLFQVLLQMQIIQSQPLKGGIWLESWIFKILNVNVMSPHLYDSIYILFFWWNNVECVISYSYSRTRIPFIISEINIWKMIHCFFWKRYPKFSTRYKKDFIKKSIFKK